MHISPNNFIESRFFACFSDILFRRNAALNRAVDQCRLRDSDELSEIKGVTDALELEDKDINRLQNSLYLALTENPGRHDEGVTMNGDNTEIPELVLGEYGSRPGRLIFQFKWNGQEVQVEAVNNSHNGISVFVQIAHEDHGAYGAVYTDSPWGSNPDVQYVRECFYDALLERASDWSE